MFVNFEILLVAAFDPALGRLDYESLSDQALMEMLIDGMEESSKKEFQDDNGNFKDISEWPCLSVSESTPLEESTVARVKVISFAEREFGVTQFPFSFLPPQVVQLCANKCNIHGTLDTSVLSPDLRFFTVSQNALHGSINWRRFPRTLKNIDISANKFTGSCKLADLPRTARTLDASRNELSGEISLSELPNGMRWIDLYTNKLSGPLHITSLPEEMYEINLSDNAFTGEFRFLVFSPMLSSICLEKNQLDSKAVFWAHPRMFVCYMHFKVLHDCFAKVEDEHGNTHPWESVICGYSDSDESDDYFSYMFYLSSDSSDSDT